MKEIEELLNRYFEGETCCEEERRLRRFFTDTPVEKIPLHLQPYRALFVCIGQKVREHREEAGKPASAVRRLRLRWWLAGAAAVLLLLPGLTRLWKQTYSVESGGNYVMIDGKRYTDADLVRKQAQEAFREVSMTQEEVLELMFE